MSHLIKHALIVSMSHQPTFPCVLEAELVRENAKKLCHPAESVSSILMLVFECIPRDDSHRIGSSL